MRREQAIAPPRAEAHDLKIEILSHMGHVLRTPLCAIIGFSELMHDGKAGPLSDPHKEYLGDILGSARELLKLIDALVDLAKIDPAAAPSRPARVHLGEAVAEVRSILRGLTSTRRARIEVEIDSAVGYAVLDAARLKQVVYGYLSTALKSIEPPRARAATACDSR